MVQACCGWACGGLALTPMGPGQRAGLSAPAGWLWWPDLGRSVAGLVPRCAGPLCGYCLVLRGAVRILRVRLLWSVVQPVLLGADRVLPSCA